MIVRVHLFARAKDLAGTDAVTVEIADGAKVADLRGALCRDQPRLAGLLARSALAVNAEFAGPALRLSADDEIALLPPVSGG
jgi:molybdopterin converting factor subunit 1